MTSPCETYDAEDCPCEAVKVADDGKGSTVWVHRGWLESGETSEPPQGWTELGLMMAQILPPSSPRERERHS